MLPKSTLEFIARSLVSRASTPANGSCPWEDSLVENTAQPIFGNTTFYHFNVYFSGACALVASVTIWYLMFLHGTHFSRPAEQVKIIKIAAIIPSYSLILWFCILVPQAYYYLDPWLNLVEAVALASFFLLLCELISPNEDQRTLFFTALDIPDQFGRKKSNYDNADKKIFWYRRKWIAIFQYPVLALLIALITNITQAAGRYCGNSFDPRFSNLWMILLENVAVSLAVMAIVLMYQALKHQLAHHKPLAKLGAFKLIVGLSFFQDIVFVILEATGNLNPTATLTYADLKVGIPTLITCAEMVPIAFFFHHAYSYKPYSMTAARILPPADSKIAAPAPISSYQGGFLGYRAYLLALSPMEVIQGFLFSFKMFSEHKHMQQSADGGYNAAMEPLTQNAAGISGHHPDLETAQTYGDGPHYGNTTTYGGYDQSYDSYSYNNATNYAQRPQPSAYTNYDGQQQAYGQKAYLAAAPAAPRASHSRSPSRIGEIERPAANTAYDNGA